MEPALVQVLGGKLETLPGFAVPVLLALVLLVHLFDWAVLPQVQLQQGRPVDWSVHSPGHL